MGVHLFCFFFFFNDTATTEIYTLSLHDALPISRARGGSCRPRRRDTTDPRTPGSRSSRAADPGRRSPLRRSEEHTSELQSRSDLVCRLLLEKKKKNRNMTTVQSAELSTSDNSNV